MASGSIQPVCSKLMAPPFASWVPDIFGPSTLMLFKCSNRVITWNASPCCRGNREQPPLPHLLSVCLISGTKGLCIALTFCSVCLGLAWCVLFVWGWFGGVRYSLSPYTAYIGCAVVLFLPGPSSDGGFRAMPCSLCSFLSELGGIVTVFIYR